MFCLPFCFAVCVLLGKVMCDLCHNRPPSVLGLKYSGTQVFAQVSYPGGQSPCGARCVVQVLRSCVQGCHV